MGILRRLSIIGVATAAAVVGVTLVADPGRSQQTPQYAPPPLSAQRHQYYAQHPQEFQQMLQRLPHTITGNPPPNNLKPGQAPVAGAWITLTNLPGANLSNPLLMTDGTVIFHQSCTANWFKLTPDSSGSYVNGAWTTIGSLPAGYTPRFFGSAVLPDGRVIIEGGEYNTSCASADTNLGAIYNPATDTWTTVNPPSGWARIGDATGIVLPNGTYMQTDCCDSPPKAALLNPTTLAWTSTGTGKFDVYDEEAIARTQNDTLLTVDAYVFAGCGKGTEIYTPGTGAWTSAGNVPNQQSDCNSNFPSFEVGPLVTRPDGTIVSFSGLTTGTAGTAIYGGIWYTGSNIPSVGGSPYTLADAPGAVLPNGNILFAASPGNWTSSEQFPNPTHYFEMDLTSNTITQVPDTSWASTSGAWETNFLVLPTGQILATDIDGTNQIQIYTPAGSYQSSWQPTVASVPSCVDPGGTFTLSGTQLNGLTEGSFYGDDTQASVAFPIVRIVSSNGQVFYAKTFNHSNRSIAPGAAVSTSFTVPAGVPIGGATLYAVAAGIPSAGVSIAVDSSCAVGTIADTHDFNHDGYSDILVNTSPSGLESPVIIGMVGNTITWEPGLPKVPAGWTIVGQRDFNGDGKTDILWRDTAGDVAIWFMNGGGVTSAASLGNVSTAWTVNGTCDFNGDGKGDILWRDSGGNVAIWFMNGSQISSEASLGNVPTSWSIVGTGDFDGDGHCDILWRDSGGNTAIWFMNGSTIVSEANLGNVPTGWSVAGTGDFNGDGKYDILWMDSGGDVAIWLMNGAAILQAAVVATVPAGWTIEQTGDFNGDGKADILWFNAGNSPNTAMWFMNGVQIVSGPGAFSLNPAWTFQNANAD